MFAHDLPNTFSSSGPVHNPREAGKVEQQQQQEYSGSHQGQARKVSPHYAFPFMNTPSPSDVSEGSQATTASPHISPQPQVQSGHHGMGAQGRASQKSLYPSPTFISLMDTSPPLMPAAQAFAYDPYHHNSPSPTYILASDNSSPPNSDSPPMADASTQRVTTYNYATFLDQQTPHSLINVSSGSPSVSCPTRVSPQPTPLSSPGNPAHHQEEAKIRNGKMYTSYLNHSGHGSYFERQSRHPSGGPTPPPGGHARAHPTGQYSRLSHVHPLPDLSLRGFFSSYQGATPQLPQAPQVQPHPSYAAQGFHNYGSQPAPPPLQFAGQYPSPGTIFSYYNSQPTPPAAAAAPRGCPQPQGGAQRNRAQAASIERPSVSDSVRERVREGIAKRAAQKTNSVPGSVRKRGCTCSRCQIVFASSGHLKRHMEAHGSNRRFKCEHPYCDVAYSRQDNLKKHAEKALHRREGDPYDIPIDSVDVEREQSDFVYFSCEGGFGVIEPSDDTDDPPPGGSGRGGGGGGVGGAGVVL